jgi:hypothetical protein
MKFTLGLFAVLSSFVANGHAAGVTCQPTGATTALQCYGGNVITGPATTVPYCKCTTTDGSCTVENNQPCVDFIPITAGFTCNAALCQQSSEALGVTNFTTVPYSQVAAYYTPFQAFIPSGYSCISFTRTCSAALATALAGSSAICNSAMVGSSQTIYGAITPAGCASLNNIPNGLAASPFTGGSSCNTNLCNAPPSPSSSSLLKPLASLVAAAGMLALYL